MTHRRLLILCSAALLAMPCAASEESTSEACKEAGSGGYNAIARCDAAFYRELDAQLSKRYTQVLGAASYSPNKARVTRVLVASQKAWVGYRDRTCELESALLSPFDEPYRLSSCMSRLTELRMKELDTYYGCLTEGGMKCPGP